MLGQHSRMNKIPSDLWSVPFIFYSCRMRPCCSRTGTTLMDSDVGEIGISRWQGNTRVRGQCQNLKGTVCQGPAAPASCLLQSGRPLHCQLSHVAERVSSPAPLRVLTLSPCSSSRLLLPGFLLWGRESLSLSLLVDSGCNESSLDAGVAQQAKIPLVRLPEPWVISDLDGRTLAEVTHHTTTVRFLFCRVIVLRFWVALGPA